MSLALVLVVARFLLFAAAMQLFGIAVFVRAIAPPALGSALGDRLRRLAIASLLVAILASLGWLSVTAATMGDGWADAINPAILQAVLADTQFGHAWQLVLAIIVVLIAGMVGRWRGQWLFVAVLSGIMLAALGLVGHLAAPPGWPGLMGRASQSIHLAAAGFWLGSLLPLALSLRLTRAEGLHAEVDVALRRFSGLGHLAVALVLATGVVNTWIILGRPPTDLASPYELLLVSKIALTLLLVGLALVNRYVLMPRLAGGGSRYLRRSALVEYAIGALVLALVAGLGTLQFA